MKRFTSFTTAILLAVILIACRESIPPAQLVVIVDASRSSLARCESLVGLADEATALPNIGKGSTLTVLATGDTASANEARLLSGSEIPRSRRVLEGRAGAAKQRTAWLDNLFTTCEAMPTTDISPIFLAVQRGLEQLRALGCTAQSGCRLFVQTDGEENVEPSLTQALNAKAKSLHAQPSPTLDNAGIGVSFCGLSETLGVDKDASAKPGKAKRRLTPDRASARAEQLRAAWQSVFTDNTSVVFAPFCPKPKTTNMPAASSAVM